MRSRPPEDVLGGSEAGALMLSSECAFVLVLKEGVALASQEEKCDHGMCIGALFVPSCGFGA